MDLVDWGRLTRAVWEAFWESPLPYGVLAAGMLAALRRAQASRTLPPFRGAWSVDWTQTPRERWAHAARQAPDLTEGYVRFLGQGPLLDAERAERRLREDLVRRGELARVRLEALRRAAQEAAPAESDPTPPAFAAAPITFNDGEPQTFAAYDGQEHFVPFLEKAVRALAHSQSARLARHELFTGPAGLGKSTLAKVLAKEVFAVLTARGVPQPDFILAVGSDLKALPKLDALLRRAARREGSIVFLDEIHTLCTSEYHDKLLLLLTDHRWQFEGDDRPTDLPDFTIVGATTDWGKMSEALRRRFEVRELEPLSREQLGRILRDQRVPIADAAAERVLAVTHWDGAPWKALTLFQQATVVARADGREAVALPDVEEVIRVKRLDELGLGANARRVLHALLRSPRTVRGRRKDEPDEVVYALSETNLVGAARVDRVGYALYTRPELLSRALLTVTSRGQTLTEAGIAHARRTLAA